MNEADASVDEPAAPQAPPRGWTARLLRFADPILAGVTALCVLAVHDVGYMLGHPFWVDEAWVALTTRARIGLLPWLTSSTPIGFTLLIRWVPLAGEQRQRLVALAFAGLAVLVAYYLGRELRLMRYVGGLLVGAAVLLVPAMLVQNDLKQYTAEAAASLTVLYLVARVENEWTRSRVAAVATFSALGIFLANTVPFVGVAAMVGLAIEAAAQRNRTRLAEVAVATGGMAAVSAVIYELAIKRNVIPVLTAYWSGYYVPRDKGIHGVVHYLHPRVNQLAPYLGFRSPALDAILAFVGIGVLIWLKRYALAAIVPVTVVLVIGASAMRKYPFGDPRTSTFWLVMVVFLMAVAAVATVRGLFFLNRPTALLAAAALVTIYVWAVDPSIRSHSIPNEDVRSQVEYVQTHRRPGDVMIVSYAASRAFAYYDSDIKVDFAHISYGTTGFMPTFPGVSGLVAMRNINPSDVSSALAQATAKVDAAAAGGQPGRIWIVRSHMHPAEIEAWKENLSGKEVVRIPVGPDPLLMYQPAQPGLTAASGSTASARLARPSSGPVALAEPLHTKEWNPPAIRHSGGEPAVADSRQPQSPEPASWR